MIEDDHPVAHLAHLLHDMGGEDYRRAAPPRPSPGGREFGKTLDEGTDLDELVGVETCGRFIKDEQFRIAEKRLCQADTLAIALGELTDMFVPLGSQSDEVDERVDRFADRV